MKARGVLPRLTTTMGKRAECVQEFVLDSLVAFARCPLEPFSMQDDDFAATATNQSSLLQRCGGTVQRRASDAKHLTEELLCNAQIVVTDAVERHKEPTTQALFDRVRAITGGRLREHRHRRPCITQQQVRERSSTALVVTQNRKRQAFDGARNLAQGSRRSSLHTQKRG